jgi:hypothetical protein
MNQDILQKKNDFLRNIKIRWSAIRQTIFETTLEGILLIIFWAILIDSDDF